MYQLLCVLLQNCFFWLAVGNRLRWNTLHVIAAHLLHHLLEGGWLLEDFQERVLALTV